MKLSVFEGKKQIYEMNLTSGQTYTIGRKETCEIILAKHPGISREHLEIYENESGSWSLKVKSSVMPIFSNGDMVNELELAGQGEFSLPPYRFYFDAKEQRTEESATEKADSDNRLENSKLTREQSTHHATETSLEEDNKLTMESFSGNDEKTSIFNFNGIPYIKIIANQGKKAEYFRLEGNLWIIGGSENASVFIKDNLADENHFEISKTEKGYFVIDSGSVTGTDLNGQRLTPKKPNRLLSGDILTLGSTSLQFELRDKAFDRKVSNIPLHMYENPLVFFDKDIAVVTTLDNEAAGKVDEISAKHLNKTDVNPRKLFLTALALVLIFAVGVSQYQESINEKSNKAKIGADPFSQLSPAEQKIVAQTHRLAKQLYLNGNFELALVQLEKLHSIIPVYKDSKEMEGYCINSRDLKRRQAIIEQQRREQEALIQRVQSFIAQCNHNFAHSQDIDGVKACLAPAMDLDPNNPGISQLISEVTAREEEAKIRHRISQERADKVRRGKELYERAQKYQKQNKYLDAIVAYENHIHSGLPDPKRLVKKSKRNLATIEELIQSKKAIHMDEAQKQYEAKKLKDAIVAARLAQRVDPYDPKISSFLFKTEKELNNKVKNIYMDSVIEERFSNLDASRIKWEEIMKLDVSDGEYYKKARRKLKDYGFKH